MTGPSDPPPKAGLRARMRAVRAEASAAVQDFGVRAAAHLFKAGAPPTGAAVAGYWPVRTEADCLPVLEAVAARGHTVALPCVESGRPDLVFRSWTPGAGLEAAPMGLRQPPASAAETQPDWILCPLLAFDGAGHRLGYGGGYYDRTLAGLRARATVVAVGVAFAAQEVAVLPAEPHDERLDGVLTETGLRWFSPPAATAE